MSYNWYQGAERCMHRLSQDFLRIKRESIDTKNYQKAYNDWNFALMDSQHLAFAPHITENFFKGVTFNAFADMLRDNLEKGDESKIKFCSDGLLGCIRQEEMRQKAEEKERSQTH